MQWSDEGIVLGVRRHGEANTILELMTRTHGRHLGLVRGGAGSRMRPVLQPGNAVSVVWRARLDEHLGHYAVEPLRLRAAAFLDSAHAIYGVNHIAALVRLLPERDPHPAIHAALDAVLEQIESAATMAELVMRFELQLLSELGFGLDLSQCAATGSHADLVYVSPKSGRAVSRAAGEPWRDKLLRLPAFLADPDAAPTTDDLAAGFALTGHFLTVHVLDSRGAALSAERERFIAAVLQRARSAPAT
jgi:DNA repair protein RecO (recombination protein O)